MRNLKLFGLLSLCCYFSQVSYGTEIEGEGKENRAPNSFFENQVKKNSTIQRDVSQIEDLPTDSNALKLRGCLTTEGLQKLRDSHYTEISLYMASGKDKDCFYKDYLIVSPKIINPNVRSLSLIICGLMDENIKEIGEFKNLEELRLSSNALTDEGVKSITQLKSLRTLNLHSNEIGDSFLELLANANIPLIDLNISCNSKVTDKGIKHIVEKILTLKKLNISCNKISREMYEKIKESRHDLEVEYFPG